MQMSEFEILRDYKEAKDKAEQVKILADMNLCTQKEIVDFLKRHGITAQNRNSWNDETIQRLKILHGQGMTDEEIADTMGLKCNYAGQVRRKLGLKRHKKRKPAKAALTGP